MKRKMMGLVFSFCFLILASGCAGTKVKRVETNQKIDLSGTWNDYDATLVSQEMIKDCLQKPWLIEFTAKQNRHPVVIVGYVSNRSYEHINTEIFIKNLEKELLNSGKIVFVASPDERDQIRAERHDQQQGNTLEETIKKIGRERGADFMLIGSLNSVKDAVKGKSVIFYQANLELVNLESNEKVWIGQKEIKKYVTQGRYAL